MYRTYLGQRGYTIEKKALSIKEQEEIRNDLTVTPFVPKSSLSKPNKFPVYRESPNKFYVPRFYGMERFGKTNTTRSDTTETINLPFKGTLRGDQIPIVKSFLYHLKSSECGLLELYCGFGKTICALHIISQLSKKTIIIVHKEFLVSQWIERINEFLPGSRIGRIQGAILDIEDKDIVIGMLQSISMKDYPCSLFRSFGLTIIDECFPYHTYLQTELGPIAIGTIYNKWREGGGTGGVSPPLDLPNVLSYNFDKDIFEYKSVTFGWKRRCTELLRINLGMLDIVCTPTHKIMTVLGYKRAVNLTVGEKILCNFEENGGVLRSLNNHQKQLVYGIYLATGKILLENNGQFEEYFNWKKWMFGAKNNLTDSFDLDFARQDDPTNLIIGKIKKRAVAIWFMENSLYDKEAGTIRLYVHISERSTQQKLIRKLSTLGIRCSCGSYTPDSALSILIEGEHNTRQFLGLIAPYIHPAMRDDLMLPTDVQFSSWDNTGPSYGVLPVISIQETENPETYVYDIEVEDNHNFVITTDSMVPVGGPVVSNCHHISAEVFSNALFKVVTPYMLGLSATMRRKDGLSKVFKMFLGEVAVKKVRPFENEVLVKGIEFQTDDGDFNKDELNFRGQIHYALMIKKLCEFGERREFIIKVIATTLEEGEKCEQIIVLAHNKNLLIYLYDAIKEKNLASVGFYIGGMKQPELKESETKKVIVATYAMAEEALDIKSLTTLIMATPKTDVTQAVGRIMRSKDVKPLIIDIIDVHPVFKRQWSRRKSYYLKNGYTITYTDDYENGNWEQLGTKKVVGKDKFMQGKCLV